MSVNAWIAVGLGGIFLCVVLLALITVWESHVNRWPYDEAED